VASFSPPYNTYIIYTCGNMYIIRCINRIKHEHTTHAERERERGRERDPDPCPDPDPDIDTDTDTHTRRHTDTYRTNCTG
jgi:hypothetical protein